MTNERAQAIAAAAIRVNDARVALDEAVRIGGGIQPARDARKKLTDAEGALAAIIADAKASA